MGVVKQGFCTTINLSFAHELAHLLAARHDWFVDNTNNEFTYNHGYSHIDTTDADGDCYADGTNNFRTIMAYANECCTATGGAINATTGDCVGPPPITAACPLSPPPALATTCTPRLGLFSNPAITSAQTTNPTILLPVGIAAGTSMSCNAGTAYTADCDANNALTLNNRRVTVANHRPGSLASAHVDSSNSGTEDGSESNPFNTVTEAAYRTAPGATVTIQAGIYPESLVVDDIPNGEKRSLVIGRSMTLTSSGGAVTVGGTSSGGF
jgi:hypothetical protein